MSTSKIILTQHQMYDIVMHRNYYHFSNRRLIMSVLNTEAIANRMREKNLTQETLGEAADLSRTTVGNILRVGSGSIEAVRRIGNALNLEPNEIFTGWTAGDEKNEVSETIDTVV
jgi:DNA-binding XRE family transcriptional regulator